MFVTKELIEQWVELYQAGRTGTDIAKEYEVSPNTVYKYLKQEGVKARQQTITNKLIQEWIKLYETGNYTISYIADKYSVSRNTVSLYLNAYGIKTTGNVPHIVEERSNNFKVELLKYPTERDWLWCKECTLNTVGKQLKSNTTSVDREWKVKLLEAEHSPIRELWFGIKMTIPYWVSVHFVRHHIGVNHYVQTQRTDRTGVNRNKLKQGEIVSHIMSVNAQELVFMAHKRLCKQASPETRKVMKMIVDEVIKVCPEMKSVLVPLCVYRNGKCTEMFPCKEVKNDKN